MLLKTVYFVSKKSAFQMTKCIYVQFGLSAYEQLVIKQFNPG